MDTIVLMVFSLLLGGGGGNDLLSLIPSDAYWKSKDIEVTVPNILLELNSIKSDDTSKATAVRRLMAIRALGELKNADAIPSLKTQLDSKDLFVADYAQRAIDAIQGNVTAPASGVPPDRMKADLYMLPEHCATVAQLKLTPGKFAAATTQPAAGDEQAAGGDAKSQLVQMANSLIYIAEMTGNIRIDGVTIGVSDEIGENQGFVAIIVRGKWDLDAVKSALQGVLPQTKAGGEEEFMTAQDAPIAVALPSDELFVMTSAPNIGLVPLDDLGNAIKTGKGKFENSADLIQAIGTIDTANPLWVAMFVSDNYRQAPQLAAFDSLTLTAKKADGGLSYQARGAGKDADAVKGAVDQLTSLIQEAKSSVDQQTEQAPMFKSLGDFLGSIELKSDGANATGTAVMKSPGS